jgi:tetratricopeptide (TPR) repeat protein
VLRFAPDFVPVHQYLGDAYSVMGDTADAAAEMRTYARLTGDTTGLAAVHIREALVRGKKAEAIQATDALLKRAPESKFGPYQAAQMYFRVGETDKGYAALERAYRDHAWVMVNLLIDSDFARVRQEPRFQAMVRRVGLPRT